ncbi:MAG: LapA family protein [Acidimicrobiia bacterium]
MTDNRPKEPGSIFTPRLLIGLAAVALFLVFVFQNSAQGEIGLLWFNATAPVWAFFIIVFALGWIAGWFSHRRSNKQ